MSEVHRYKVVKMVTAGGNKLTYTPHGPEIVMAEHYDALAAQRDEGLAREAELQKQVERLRVDAADVNWMVEQRDVLQQRLAEAEKDAARYRWLRDRPLDGSEPFWIAVSSDDVYQTRCWALGGSSPDTCDQAIDKAMSSAGPANQEQQS